MNRKITLGAAVTLAIMFAAVTFIMTMIYARNSFDSMVFNLKERETMYAKLAEVDRLVRQKYYNKIDEKNLEEQLVSGYIEGIEDKYGAYLTAEQYSQLQSDYDGRMVDIGVVCSQDVGGYILIDEVYPESPAALSELMPGDVIIKVDELAVTAENYEEAVDALKGDPGTTVTVVVRRANVENSYTITRRKVEVPSVYGNMMDEVGYIRIVEFNDNTPNQFFRILTEQMEQGARGFIFDVRSNAGGTLESVCDILDRLLPDGPIVSAVYKNSPQPKLLYSSDAEEISMPMTVLINGKSASAAELFAQALKDYNKAKAIGTTTYGKGSMQEIHKLSDGSAVDITVALYQPPFSENFEGKGVKPDYDVKMSAELEKEIGNLDEYSDPQLKKALEVVNATLKNQTVPGEITPPAGEVPGFARPAESSSVPAVSEPESSSAESESDAPDNGEESDDTQKEDEGDSSSESEK